ncbi:hypothetical protein [Mangrovactinospora gilvigrisea]|uniref:hypothetical protein n=1 Tax=Mangrovactinospora gilvigrisea TaxID=1428644 RepID=UPI000A93789A|nr:hypothetical protein [Mangrovactinospora gilvigrisea]
MTDVVLPPVVIRYVVATGITAFTPAVDPKADSLLADAGFTATPVPSLHTLPAGMSRPEQVKRVKRAASLLKRARIPVDVQSLALPLNPRAAAAAEADSFGRGLHRTFVEVAFKQDGPATRLAATLLGARLWASHQPGGSNAELPTLLGDLARDSQKVFETAHWSLCRIHAEPVRLPHRSYAVAASADVGPEQAGQHLRALTRINESALADAQQLVDYTAAGLKLLCGERGRATAAALRGLRPGLTAIGTAIDQAATAVEALSAPGSRSTAAATESAVHGDKPGPSGDGSSSIAPPQGSPAPKHRKSGR